VAQKVVSKAEGAIVDLREMQPSALASAWAAEWGKDPRLIELILSQSRRIVKMDRGVLVTETRLGLVCANAGVDQSNTENDDIATVLPDDPDASARRLRAELGLRRGAGDRYFWATLARGAGGCGHRSGWPGAGRRSSRLHGPARAAALRYDHRGSRSTGRGGGVADAQGQW